MISRLFETFISLFLLSLISFALLKVLPGSPFEPEVALSQEIRSQLEENWKLNSPWPLQYSHFVKQFISGSWGVSLQNPEVSVFRQVLTAGRTTFQLGFFAFVFVALSVGLCFYLMRNQLFLNFIKYYNFVILSAPTLFVGPFLIWLFAIQLEWLPLAFLESPLHFILPVLVLSLRPVAVLLEVLILRESEVQGLDFLRTARAKGLSESQVRWSHVLPTIIIPVIAYLPQLVMGLVSGAFIVEIFFAIPGLGTEMVRAIDSRDSAILVFLITALGFFWILLSQLTDFFLQKLDPRLRGSQK